MLTCFYGHFIQLAYVYCISICNTCCYAADFALFVNGNLIIDCGQTANHEYRCTNAVLHACPTFSEYQLAGVVADGLNAFQVFVQRQTFFVNSKVCFVFVQLNRNCIVLTVNCNAIACSIGCIGGTYSIFQTIICFLFFYLYIITGNQGSMLACFGCYFLQLLFGCSFTGSCKASISSSFIAKSAYGCSSTIHNNTACFYTACCYFAACPDSAFAAADAYKSVRIISCKINIVLQSNFIFLATVCIEAFVGYSNINTIIGNSTVFECFFVYFFQLCNVYSVGICSTCCNVGDLASYAVTAHRYSTFSSLPGCIRLTVSTIAKHACSCACYAAGTQSNTAFTNNFGIMTENNSVINSCFGYFISRAENNVILTAYLVIITDNLIAVCGNFIFNTDYSNIRCIGNSVLITVNKVILCSLSFSTGYFIFYAGQLGVFSVISLVATADCHYRTACIIAGLHGFNSFFLCFRNRNIIPVGVNADFFNGVGNFVAGTPD